MFVVLQHQNFEEQMQGMKTQLIQLSTLLRLLDLAFWNYLGMSNSAVCQIRLGLLKLSDAQHHITPSYRHYISLFI